MTAAPIPPHDYLTVRELADLLRLKERKVYDLAASGALPCSRATGKLLFPATEIRDWIARAQSGGLPAQPDRPRVFLGSHDPLLDWAIRQSRCGLATYFDGSEQGLRQFCAREGVATGLHLPDPSGGWNRAAAQDICGGQDAVLLRFATRRRGLVLRPDGPAPQRLGDLAGLRIVARQEGSGSQRLLQQLIRQEGLDPATLSFTAPERTEDEAVQCVRRGEADAALGLDCAARAAGLPFVPLVEESFDLLCDRKAVFDPPLQSLLEFCRSPAFQDRATSLGGYDVTGLGRVVWNG